jgi:hypothetical protein
MRRAKEGTKDGTDGQKIHMSVVELNTFDTITTFELAQTYSVNFVLSQYTVIARLSVSLHLPFVYVYCMFLCKHK